MTGPETLEPGVRCLRAPNPSPMTGPGTNSYLLGERDVTVIDPGPLHVGHLSAILVACEGRVEQILVTHAHLDHSPGAAWLSGRTGAPVLAYGDALAGRSEVMADLSGLGGGEGVDADFSPDRELADGETVETGAGPVTAYWTPGHFGNHMVFEVSGAVFSGDLVMGWASTFVSPPDGDVTRFMASCRRLRDLHPRVLYPGHGDPVTDSQARIDWLIAHRDAREKQILGALEMAPGTPYELATRIYTDVAPSLLPAAARNVLAHLIDLKERNLAETAGDPRPDTTWRMQ